MKEMNLAALHKVLNDATRRSILQLLAEREAMNYTEIMTVLNITNTGRLNYHLKNLGDLITKDAESRYRLTERGELAAELLKSFPERTAIIASSSSTLRKVVSLVLMIVGILILGALAAFVALLVMVSQGQFELTISFEMLLISLLLVGLILIVLGILAYKNKILTSV